MPENCPAKPLPPRSFPKPSLSVRRWSTTCNVTSHRSAVILPPPGLYQRVLAEVEYPLVLAAMTATRGNQIKAADLLGLNRNTLRKKIRDLGINIYKSAR